MCDDYCGFQMRVAVFRKPDLCERREFRPKPADSRQAASGRAEEYRYTHLETV
jgi:hypothetical protein